MLSPPTKSNCSQRQTHPFFPPTAPATAFDGSFLASRGCARQELRPRQHGRDGQGCSAKGCTRQRSSKQKQREAPSILSCPPAGVQGLCRHASFPAHVPSAALPLSFPPSFPPPLSPLPPSLLLSHSRVLICHFTRKHRRRPPTCPSRPRSTRPRASRRLCCMTRTRARTLLRPPSRPKSLPSSKSSTPVRRPLWSRPQTARTLSPAPETSNATPPSSEQLQVGSPPRSVNLRLLGPTRPTTS